MKRTMISLLSLLPLTFAACGGSSGNKSDGGTSTDCTPSGGTNKAQYVTNVVTVPQTKSDFAIDLNGDGRADNQLGSIVSILKTENLSVQDGVTMAVAAGTLVILASETSSDATFQTDSCATSVIERGSLPAGVTTPDYTGTGAFVAVTDGAGTFNGPITGGKFSSGSPVTTKSPVSLTILLPLIAGAAPVELDVEGGQLEFKRDATGVVTGGELHGFLTSASVQSKVVPNVALLLTSKVSEANPTATDMQIGSIFDTGGAPSAACNNTACANPDGTCAVSGDKKIDICEVSTNNLIQQVLAPDIQMFQNGVYAPNAANTTKDSLSLGLGFTFVKATF
jgi:hypothetical protein